MPLQAGTIPKTGKRAAKCVQWLDEQRPFVPFVKHELTTTNHEVWVVWKRYILKLAEQDQWSQGQFRKAVGNAFGGEARKRCWPILVQLRDRVYTKGNVTLMEDLTRLMILQDRPCYPPPCAWELGYTQEELKDIYDEHFENETSKMCHAQMRDTNACRRNQWHVKPDLIFSDDDWDTPINA